MGKEFCLRMLLLAGKAIQNIMDKRKNAADVLKEIISHVFNTCAAMDDINHDLLACF